MRTISSLTILCIIRYKFFSYVSLGKNKNKKNKIMISYSTIPQTYEIIYIYIYIYIYYHVFRFLLELALPLLLIFLSLELINSTKKKKNKRKRSKVNPSPLTSMAGQPTTTQHYKTMFLPSNFETSYNVINNNIFLIEWSSRTTTTRYFEREERN